MRTFGKGIVADAPFLERCAFYAAVFSLPLQALAIVPGLDMTITKVAGALLVVSVAGRRILAGKAPFARSGIESGILVFALACILSVPGSMNRGDSLRAIWTFAQYALVFHAVVRVSSRGAVQERIPWLIIGASAVAGFGALVAMSGHLVTPTVDTPVPHSNIRRLCFGLPDANEQALFFLFAMAFLLFSPGLWRGPRRILCAGSAACLIAMGMVLTMSRSGWVCAMVLILGRGLLARKRVLYGAALALFASAVLGVLAMAWPDSIDLAKRRVREAVGIGDHSLASRVAHYTSVIETAREGGAFGHGLDTTLELSQSFRDPRGERIGVIVHSVPLIIWLDLGWVGLLCYGWLWSCIAAHFCVGYRRAPPGADRGRIMAFGALVAVYALVSLVMPFVYRSGFAILLGCAVGAINRASSISGADGRPAKSDQSERG